MSEGNSSFKMWIFTLSCTSLIFLISFFGVSNNIYYKITLIPFIIIMFSFTLFSFLSIFLKNPEPSDFASTHVCYLRTIPKRDREDLFSNNVYSSEGKRVKLK